MHAFTQRPRVQTKMTAGLSDREQTSVDRVALRNPRIRLLLFGSFPATVGRIVRAIVFFPPQGLPLWGGTHVAQEGGKTTPPFFAHPDSATSVRRIFRALLVVTASFCIDPSVVLTGVPRLIPKDGAPMAVLRLQPPNLFGSEATAAFNMTADNLVLAPMDQRTAVTFPLPIVTPDVRTNRHEATEALAWGNGKHRTIISRKDA